MQNQTLKLIVIHIGYLTLMIMAILFYQDRLASDTCYYFFKTINTEWFHIEHQRWVLALAELPVVLMVKMGASLKFIAIIFSIWHLFFFYLIGGVVFKLYKDASVWLLLLMLQTFGIMYGFVGPIFEQFYGTALAVLFYSLLKVKRESTNQKKWILILLAAWILTSHPFNVILLVYLLVVDYIEFRNVKKYLWFVFLIPLYVVFKWAMASEYESGKMNWIFNVTQNKTYLLLFDVVHVKARLLYLLHYYWDVLLVWIGYTFLLIRRGSWLKLMVSFLFVAGVVLLINFSYDITEYSGYHEQVYYLLVPIILIPFMMNEFKSLNTYPQLIVIVIISIFIGFHIVIQYNYAKNFSQKRDLVALWIKNAQSQSGTKFMVMWNDYHFKSGYVNWDMPFYTLLYSSMHRFEKQVTVYPLENEKETIEAIVNTQFWFRPGEVLPLEKLNKNYFKLTPTNYKPLRINLP